jgi:hypothetical protein
MGGPDAKRKDFPISIAKQWNDKPNRYQEPKGYEVIGISYGNVTIPTRIHQWTVTCQPENTNLRVIVANSNSLSEGGFNSFDDFKKGALAPLEYCQ